MIPPHTRNSVSSVLCVCGVWCHWCQIETTVMDIKYPDGPFCLCALGVPHPSLLGHKSAKKAFGKRILLAALPKRVLSLLSRFFFPCISISQDFVVLGFIFCFVLGFIFLYFAVWKVWGFFLQTWRVVIHIHGREVFPAPACADKDLAVSHSKLTGIVWGLPDQIRANSQLIPPLVRPPLPNNFPNCHFDKAVIR